MAFFIAHMESIDNIILNNPVFPSHGPEFRYQTAILAIDHIRPL